MATADERKAARRARFECSPPSCDVRRDSGPAPMFPPWIRAGQRAVVVGLVARADLNGSTGVISERCSWNDGDGRVTITVSEGSISVKPANLMVTAVEQDPVPNLDTPPESSVRDDDFRTSPMAAEAEVSDPGRDGVDPVGTVPPDGPVPPDGTVPSSTRKEAEDELRKVRQLRRELAAKERRLKKRVAEVATASGGQAHPGDKRGRGHARAKRSAKEAARSTAAKRPRTAPKIPNACAFFTDGDDNRCQGGYHCERAHTGDVSTANRARWARKLHNAASSVNRERTARGPAPVAPDAVRMGRVVNCMFGKGFGFIEPDALADGANGRKQLIFFHFRDWTGPIDTRPSSNADVPCKVRYVRVPDQREHGKWKAINVAQRR
eukprot:m.59348 g.59348  ORF g.59348 m.59348 type:complete len:380 (-) comp17327_c0_seq1:120-1259(-)